MKKIILLLLLIISIAQTNAQTLTGQLKQHAGQTITLTGFEYYKNYELATTTADSLGNFILNYPKTYKGMGILKTQDNNSLILMLTQAQITLKGTHIAERDKLQFNNSENKIYFNYALTQALRTNALSAWGYLEKLYSKEPQFLKQKSVAETILNEQQRILKEDASFLISLDKDSYLPWFITQRKLIQEMPTIVRTQTEKIPEAIAQFRNTNIANVNFKTSGLLKDFIEGHYLLLENMGQSLDSIAVQMNLSTDNLIQNLKQNDSLLNTVSKELLTYFEKRSLFPAAAHLSHQLLTDNKCVLNDNLANTMQKYVTLKVGNTAPDIQLNNGKLSNFKKPVLLVFGASWCPHCKEEALQLLQYYDTWKIAKNVEVVYISIDTDKEAYKTAYKNAPWQSYCDYKGWDTQAAKDYFVNATPTYILLDKDLKILVHPSSIEQVNSWVNYKL